MMKCMICGNQFEVTSSPAMIIPNECHAMIPAPEWDKDAVPTMCGGPLVQTVIYGGTDAALSNEMPGVLPRL